MYDIILKIRLIQYWIIIVHSEPRVWLVHHRSRYIFILYSSGTCNGSIVFFLSYLEASGHVILFQRKKKWWLNFCGLPSDLKSAFFTKTYVFCFGGLICSGTPEGDIVIVNSTNMQIQTMIKKAHLGVVTALAFSPDSRFVMNIFFCCYKSTVYALCEGILV